MNATPGKYNELEIVKYTDFGIYLDGGDLGEILMPAKYVPDGTNAGDKISCFVYYDTEDRPIATTEKPYAVVGECAFLECVATSKFGAFLNWGLTKDLLVPFREQKLPMEKGNSYIVFIYTDDRSNRIVGTAKIEKRLNLSEPDFEEGDEVDLLIARKTDKGFVAIINNTHTGLIYANEIFKPLRTGDRMRGYINKIREDGKTDLRLQRSGYSALQGQDKEFIEILKSHGGFVAITDKSSPEEIYSIFQMSKKNWKKLLGNLYKRRIVQIHPEGIRLEALDSD